MLLLILFSTCLSLVTTVTCKSVSQPSNGRCLSSQKHFYSLFSTSTPYDDVRGNIPRFKDCKPTGLWAFVRHGTRFPKEELVLLYKNMTKLRDQIVQNHAENRGSLCRGDLERLRTFEIAAEVQENMLLTSSGVQELRKLGIRLHARFPNLMEEDNLDVVVTSKVRTRQSAEALVSDIFEGHMKIDSSRINNTLIKNDRGCPAWKLSTKNPILKREMDILKNSTEMQELISSVSRRLGFVKDLEFGVIKNIYDLCGFEYSWYHRGKSAIWCSAFSDRETQLMEYMDDLGYYYKSGFGNEYVAKLGCSFVQDIIEKFSSKSPKSTFYFGHSSGHRKVLTALGIGGDDRPLRGDGFERSAGRKWRSSLLTPFAANVIAVRLRCKKASFDVKEKSRIAVFVNEVLTPLRLCGRKDMCGMSEFVRAFDKITNEEFCNKDWCGPYDNRSFLPGSDDDDDFEDDDD